MKYWKLRGRLIGDERDRHLLHDNEQTNVHNGFMVVPSVVAQKDTQGFSEPAEYRLPYEVNEWYFGHDNCKGQFGGAPWIDPGLYDPRDGEEYKGTLKWADNQIQMAHYIAMLSYEWSLLDRVGQDKTETEKELYYVLKAVDRLDAVGNQLWGLSPDIDGYSTRDDVPEDFALSYMGKHFDFVNSGYSCPADDCKNATSYDQLIALIWSFAVLNQFVDGSASYNGESIRYLSRLATINILTNLNSTLAWTLRDPKDFKAVCAGSAGGFAYAFALAEAGRIITKQTGTEWNFQDHFSIIVSSQIFSMMRESLRSNNTRRKFFFAASNAIHNFFSQPPFNHTGPVPIEIHTNDNVTMFLEAATASRLTAPGFGLVHDPKGRLFINDVCSRYGKQFFELVSSSLVGYEPMTNDNYWRYEFNKLDCAGCNCIQFHREEPAWYKNCIHFKQTHHLNDGPVLSTVDAYPWTTTNRWIHWRRHENYWANEWSDHAAHVDPVSGEPNAPLVEEFNGIDYMAAFNAYLYKWTSLGHFNRMRVNFGWDAPFLWQGQYIANDANPYKLKAVFSIEAESKLRKMYGDGVPSQSANVKFVAGTSVLLKPGFEAQKGTLFETIIGTYDCEPNIYSGGDGLYRTTGEDDDLSGLLMFGDSSVIGVTEDEPFTDTIAFPVFDSSVLYIEQRGDTLEGDTIIIGIRPCYDFDENNNLVYICDSSGQRSAPIIEEIRIRAFLNRTFNSIKLYPNPTNNMAYLEYELHAESKVEVGLTNILGQDVSYVIDKLPVNQPQGRCRVVINCSNLKPGLYYCKIRVNDREEVKKLTVM